MDVELQVNHLIDHRNYTWKLQELKKRFAIEDINDILFIPISSTGSPDRIIWHHTKSGIYEVKYGYHLARKIDRSSISNSDASLQKEKNMTSIGMTAMDSSGNLLQVLGSPIQFVRNTIIAEALAIRTALEKAQENGRTKVQILSDAKSVVNMVMKRSVASWEIDTTCEDI
ncbi:hypothetical protein P3L10_002348 [Capsicum annuum]